MLYNKKYSHPPVGAHNSILLTENRAAFEYPFSHNLIPEVASRGLKEGRVVSLGDTLAEGGQQGIFIPGYVAAEHPDIKTLADALSHPELFPSP